MRAHEQDGLPEALLSTLLASSPWNEQVQSLGHLTELALSPSPNTLRQLRSLTPYFQSAINSPRSTLVRSVCETISKLAETLQAPFVEAVGNAIIPDLVARSSVTKAVIRDSCVTAARSLFEHGVEGVHFATVKTLAETVTDRRSAPSIRSTASLFLGLILVDNCRSGVQYITNVLSTAIIAGCADPDETVRANSRQNWRRLQVLDPAAGAEVLRSLPPQTVQLINREREEYGDGGSFRVDRGMPARVNASAEGNIPTRPVARSGFRPARVMIEEQPIERKRRPYLRPPRRSILPGSFANLPPVSPDDSPPKRSEMHPARRVFSPMAIDQPAPLDTPASVSTAATAGTPPSAREPSSLDAPVLRNIGSDDQATDAKSEDSLDGHVAPDSAKAISEKSTVSTLSSSSGSQAGVTETSRAVAQNVSHTTASSVSSIAATEKSVSAVSSSSVSTASSPHEEAFQKIAGSGASRGTNEDSPSKTPPQSLHHQSDSLPNNESPPETKKGRLSFILGANQTPLVYTPLPPVARMVEPQERIQPFTPMDICTPMKTEDADGQLSGVVVKPLVRSLDDRLNEVARDIYSEKRGEEGSVSTLEYHESHEERGLTTDKLSSLKTETTGTSNVEKSPSGNESLAATGSRDSEKKDDENLEQEYTDAIPEITKQIAEQSKSVASGKQPADAYSQELPELPFTLDSLEDELLKEVASLTSSSKKQDPEVEDTPEETSWDTLVQDLEKTLGISAPVIDDPPVSDPKPAIEPPTEQKEVVLKVETVRPGTGKENQLPMDPQKQPQVDKPLPDTTATTKVQDMVTAEVQDTVTAKVQDKATATVQEKEKNNTEMTKAERQAALARRPPRRSIHPGAIKPMLQEKRPVRPSLPASMQPTTERRKPPVPSFARKPSVPRKSTAANKETTRPPSQVRKEPTANQRPPTTARKTPATTRKLPPNRPRISTATATPGPSVPSASTSRSKSVPQLRAGSSASANPVTQTSAPPQPTTVKPVSGLPPRTPKATVRKQTPRQAAVIEAYRECARAKKRDWSTKLESLKALATEIQGLQGDSLPPRLCDDATALLGEYIQEAQYKVQLAALDALFYLLLCTELAPQISAMQRSFEKRPEILRKILANLKDGREDVRHACGRVMRSFEVLFGPEIQVGLLMKAISGVEGKIVEMGCAQMLKAFERAQHGDGFVWKAGMLESLVTLLASLKQNRRVEVRQNASKALDAVKECLPERAFEIVCKKVGVSA